MEIHLGKIQSKSNSEGKEFSNLRNFKWKDNKVTEVFDQNFKQTEKKIQNSGLVSIDLELDGLELDPCSQIPYYSYFASN